MIFTQEKVSELTQKIAEAKSIVITAHKSPDGDSIGSSLALFHFLSSMGKKVSICHPDPAPGYLQWMQGSEHILNAEENQKECSAEFKAADIIFCLDYNSPSRLGPILSQWVAQSPKFKVMIDHHLNPADFCDIMFSDTASCSTAQMIYELIDAMNELDKIDEATGEAIYCGIMTDTGSFRFPSTTARTHEVIADIMKRGTKNYKVHESVFDTNTVDKLKLRGYALSEKMEIIEEYNTAIISLSNAEQDRYNCVKGDTEGLVNIALSVTGITKAVFFKESDGIIKISFRSKGQDNPVNELASTYFEGGGHANASGGKSNLSLEETIVKFKKVLPEFC